MKKNALKSTPLFAEPFHVAFMAWPRWAQVPVFVLGVIVILIVAPIWWLYHLIRTGV